MGCKRSRVQIPAPRLLSSGQSGNPELNIIELVGRINEQGLLEFEQPTHLPPGAVRIIIETIDPEAEAADDAQWDEQFANSPDVLDFLVREAREDYLNGLTDEFDPDTDPDAP